MSAAPIDPTSWPLHAALAQGAALGIADAVAAAVPTPDVTHARDLLARDMKLVQLARFTKRPLHDRWNDPSNFARSIDLDATGYGLPLVANQLCSIDPDRVDLARVGFAALGLDLDALMAAGARTVSTRPGSGGRSAFRSPDSLGWITFSTREHGTILELRAGASNLQDCVPGVVYVDKQGELRTQTYADDTTYTLEDAPDPPADLLALWQGCTDDIGKLHEAQVKFAAAVGGTVQRGASTGRPGSGAKLAFRVRGRAALAARFDIPTLLEKHGYGFDQKTGRWSRPGAEGAPGIAEIPGKDGLWHSHDGGDPLCGSFDGWSAYVVLEHGGDVDAALAQVKAEGSGIAFGHGPEGAPRAVGSSGANPSAATDSGSPPDDVTAVTPVTPSNHAGSGVTSTDEVDVTAVTPRRIPTMAERPRYVVLDELLVEEGHQYRAGVWYFGVKRGSKEEASETPVDEWICSPLHVEAVTFDGQHNNFGRLLRFKTTTGQWREWAMPMEMLRGSGEELRGELLAMGVQIDPGMHRQFGRYLQSLTPNRRVRCALTVGWCGKDYVLPDEVIGPGAAGVIFQSGERGHEEHSRGGTFEGWKTEVAAKACGNPLLMIAISASFAGPLLARTNAEGGGIHLVGDSSTGKTTAIEAACATWGGPGFRRSWRATANGMEGAAALFNDCMLALDEISEADPHEVGAIVYSLGNGRGKQRATRSGSARSVVQWRTVVLSSGERTIATTMSEVGRRVKAGQSVRLLDIPAARRFGAWDELHGAAAGSAFSDAIKRGAATHHGHAGREFVQRLTRDDRDLIERLNRIKDLPQFAVSNGEGQERRAAGRFALFALAGELATEYGLTGWPQGAAIDAAAECFRAWRAERGRGNDERRQILDAVASFIDKHGDSRFSSASGESYDNQKAVHQRAGWWRDEGLPDSRVYLFNKDGLREALKSFDFGRALDVLQQEKVLPPPTSGGERSRSERINAAGGTRRVYPIDSGQLRAGDGA